MTNMGPALLLTLALAAQNQIVWVEAERFADPGGWVNDPQFIDQMGSPFLLAAGMGKPVRNALTTVRLPAPGRYRLWVRTRDWIPQHHPGRFDVLLDGAAAGHGFGASGRPGWHWEDGGIHSLAREVKVELHDLTGYYARCDAIVLARDVDWTPPDSVAAVAALRRRYGGVSARVRDMPPYDVVVVGGGLAGCTAAVAAARNGARVALIQNRPVLGGNSSPEILVPPVGWWPGKRPVLEPAETGFVEEYRTEGRQVIAEGKLYSQRLLRFVTQEPAIDLHLNTHATGVEMMPGTERAIAAVLTVDTRTGERARFRARLFVDATGDAVVGVAAGADYRQGRDAKATYNEPWAPETANRNTMGNGLKYFVRKADHPRPFVRPAWAYEFKSCSVFAKKRHPGIPKTEEIGNQWVNELGGLRDTYADGEEIRDDLLRLIFGLWDHTRNHCTQLGAEAAGYDLAWVGYIMGKRENRRLLGDHVLTMNDVRSQTLFPDRVAFGAWSLDDHVSDGFFGKEDTVHSWGYDFTGLPFSIPFRSLYSRNVENLLMAGRDISATHLAMSDTRVQLTCAVMGHAVGTAAAMCLEKRVSPRGLWQDYMPQLQQQLLKEGANVIGLAENDPRDLAPKARALASSEGAYQGRAMPARNVIDGFARLIGGDPKAWYPDPNAAAPHWVELVWPKPVTFNMVHVTFQTARLAPTAFTVQAWRAGRFESVAEVRRNRHRRHVLGLERISTTRLRLMVAEPRPVCEIRVYDEPAPAVAAARRAHHTMRLPDTGPFLPWEK